MLTEHWHLSMQHVVTVFYKQLSRCLPEAFTCSRVRCVSSNLDMLYSAWSNTAIFQTNSLRLVSIV